MTGAKLAGSSYTNSVSLDQFIAESVGDQTRFGSLTLSSDGGVGEPTRSTTLSFSKKGRPVPALARPHIDPTTLTLQSSPEGPKDYIRTMYDLMYLAFQTDTTRVATYMIGQVSGATTVANTFPACLGLEANWHGLAHGAGKKNSYETLGRFDQFLAEQLSYFLTRLKEIPEGDGNLLDRTIVLYGSSNSKTHNNTNYPLVLAGGGGLGMKHGQYLRFGADTPLSNVFVTMLERLKVSGESFADSTGNLNDQLT